MNSLLDRLKRGLRELGQNPRDHARTQIDRAGDRRDGDAAPQRRSEHDAAPQSPGSADASRRPDAKLPPQQPVPPASTRLKKAQLSKARRSAPPRQAATIWGAAPTSSAQSNSWLGAPAGDHPGLFAGANLAGADPDPRPSPNAAPASSHGGFFGAAHHAAPAHDHSPWSPASTPTPPPSPAFAAAPAESPPPPSLLDGAPSFGRSDDVAPPSDRLF